MKWPIWLWTAACANGAALFFEKIMVTLSYARIVGIMLRRRKERVIRKRFTRRDKVGRILDTVPSSSNPGKTYDIMEGKDGVIYCTCTAWKMRKTCKHLKAWEEKNQAPESHAKGEADPVKAVVSEEVSRLRAL